MKLDKVAYISQCDCFETDRRLECPMGGLSIWHWLIVATVALLPGFAAYWLARRKGRNDKGWGTLSFFIPITLPIITVLRKTDDAPTLLGRWFVIPLAAAANIVVAGEVILLLVGLQENGGVGLPTCDSTIAKDTAIEAIKSSPMGKVFGLEIVDFGTPTEITSNAAERHCKIKVLLNNSFERTANYRIFTRANSQQWFVEVQLEDQ